ncbi:MAG TPA: YgiQ family radical SAM protein [Candidatus Faecivicinus avistercoris]|nr:YgiQ family radical SAM protein [Candidatus Faecivicinus avistercoris]
MNHDFLPVTWREMRERGWDAPDFVYVTGDAYVDHPSFGLAIISRVLERAGYRVAMLPQPDWHTCEDFRRFGRPKIGFLVTAGVIDSMVNHYTAAKKPRSEDAYSPGGKAGRRPDRATIVYCNRIREAYADVPIAIGGVEASLRRFAHYDYWDDRVRNSILVDSGADVLMFGMGERAILRVAEWMRGEKPFSQMRIPGTCVMAGEIPEGFLEIESSETVAGDRTAYARAFAVQYAEQDPVRGRPIAQKHQKRYLLQNVPDLPLSQAELDVVYALPYVRTWHPMYADDGGVPAIDEVRFSIAAVRGCFGACSFCALTFHQGRIVTSRSRESILAEGRLLTEQPGFKGYIHDVGGPTANFRHPACEKQLKSGACKNRQCLFPSPCKNLIADHREFVDILRSLRALPGVKKVFVRSGIRYDYVLADRRGDFLDELVRHHVSGQLKVAPEHVSPNALKYMGKPPAEVYDRFVQRYKQANERAGLKQYLVPYFMSSHPGCTLDDAIALALYMKRTGQHPDQVQDFYPTPGTLSTAMFYTGIDPRDMKPVYVPRDPREKAMQRALMQYNKPQNHALVLAALRRAGREDLIGFGRECLVPPRLIAREKGAKKTGDGGKNPKASGKPRKSLPKKTAGGGKISSSGRVSGKTGKKPTSSRRHRD